MRYEKRDFKIFRNIIGVIKEAIYVGFPTQRSERLLEEFVKAKEKLSLQNF